MIIKSLKTRMILAFSGFSILLALFYWGLLALFLLFSEDTIFNQQVGIELKRQQTYYLQRGKFDQLPTGMSIYLGEEINNHPDADTIIRMPPGIDELEELNLHVANTTFQSKPLYIVYNVRNQDIDHESLNWFNQIGLIVFMIVSITGAGVGILMGRRTARPILRLDERIQGLEKNAQFGETASFGPDEIGRLAHSFAEAYDRSQQFLIREKRFTREVSHELRTPTAVIRGALDILEVQPDNPAALQRIRRANNKTQQLIETFLLLGREENLSLSDEFLDSEYVCTMLVEQHQKNTSVPISFEQTEDPQLQILPPLFMVLLNNLLENAIRHTTEGEIRISLNKQQLTVADTGSGFPPDMLPQLGQAYLEGSSGQGLGLSIVVRICQQFGWSVKVDSETGNGSRVHILFS